MKSEYVRKGNLVLYHDSLFSGVAIHKTDSGQIVAIENYKNGLADGTWKEWYKTGELKFEGAYKEGLNDGVWTQWYIDGRVQRKLTFVNGKLVSDK
jgi:antitoxin component YwqK of YwqJK toxin-antitoxin module